MYITYLFINKNKYETNIYLQCKRSTKRHKKKKTAKEQKYEEF